MARIKTYPSTNLNRRVTVPEEAEMEARERFQKALMAFIAAGNDLVEAWDGEGFNADDAFGPAVDCEGKPLFSLSVDEWLLEVQGHFDARERGN